jgi:glycosyltransferase involved in cell wall biosynthesis
MKKLTVIIPTFNEEDFLEKALYSVKFADEIIVIDSFSCDKTELISKFYKCKFIQRKFDNFSNQKNYALKYATSEWVLFLDADERITYTLQKEILEAIKNSNHQGYKLSFPHFFMNRFLFNQSSSVTRLVVREKCHFEGSVHEKLIVKGSTSSLKNPVLHYTYKGLEHYIKKKDKYAWFQAEQLLQNGKNLTLFQLIFKPFYRFFHSFFIRGGFRDGIPALAIAGVNAYGVLSRYAKMILLKKELK